VRPGEKLFEQLATDAEHADKTKHPKIFIGRIASPAWTEVSRGLDELVAFVDDVDARRIRAALRALVPEYTGGLVPLPERQDLPQQQALLAASPAGAELLPRVVTLDRLSELPPPGGRPEAPEAGELANPRRSTGSHPALAVQG
jgi:hypothetical protein